MNQASTNLNNTNLTNDYISPATDFWDPDFNYFQSDSDMNWGSSDFREWPVLPAENVTSFENADLLEPDILGERNIRGLKTIFVTLSLPEKTARSFAYNTLLAPTPFYASVEERFGSALHQTLFSPDFFNIKKYSTCIIGQTPVSILEEWVNAFEVTRNIPIIIHPEVIQEAKEEAVTDDLDTSIKIAEDSYSTLIKIEVSIEHDPEILDRKTIRFGLTVSGEPETILQNEALFKQRLRSSINRRTRELITVTYVWEE
ncbi:MAG: hypothetical protein H8D56_03650 [Planctomycetes bacterium]|nr:hypothetical protein [Planctomycetota bacterium]